MPSARSYSATDQSWELTHCSLHQSNRQIQTGSSAGRRSLIPRNISTVKRERERERMSHIFYCNILMRFSPIMSGHYNRQNGLLRLSCFPESVGLNDHYEGPQIQLKVITGATSSQTNNRVRPRQSFVIFSNPDDQTTVRSPSDHHPGSRSLRYLAH